MNRFLLVIALGFISQFVFAQKPDDDKVEKDSLSYYDNLAKKSRESIIGGSRRDLEKYIQQSLKMARSPQLGNQDKVVSKDVFKILSNYLNDFSNGKTKSNLNDGLKEQMKSSEKQFSAQDFRRLTVDLTAFIEWLNRFRNNCSYVVTEGSTITSQNTAPSPFYDENWYNRIPLVGRPHTHKGYNKFANGAAHDVDFYTNGYHKAHEYEVVSNLTDYTKLDVVLLCQDGGGEPVSCDCRGKLDVSVEYDASLSTTINHSGAWSKAASSMIQEIAIVNLQLGNNLSELANKSLTIEHFSNSTWNQSAIVEAIKVIGGIITSAISGTPITPQQMSDAANLFGQTYIKKDGTLGAISENMKLKYYNVNRIINANTPISIYLNTINLHKAKGYGGSSKAESKSRTAYFMMLQLSSAGSSCCSFDRIGVWHTNSRNHQIYGNTYNKLKSFYVSNGWQSAKFPSESQLFTNHTASFVFKPN